MAAMYETLEIGYTAAMDVNYKICTWPPCP